MQQETINDIYSEYFLGNLKREEFEGIIYKYLVKNKEKTCIKHWKQDEYEDFISHFYSNLKKVIDSYEDTGSSFEAYLYRYMIISAKEYQVRMTTNAVVEYSTWSARIPEMYAYEEPPIYHTTNNTEEVITKMISGTNGRKNTRRILALILKCYYYVSDDFAEKIAPLIGIDVKELTEMLNKIRKIRRDKDDNIYFLKERIYCQFYRCIVYEKRLSLMRDNTLAYEKLYRRLDAARQRLESMRNRITTIRKEATHKQIAEVIGISKGTVDASLHRLKEKWESMAKKANLN
jgi:DNA-directed RNA polymerase specialized sigma subunit